MSRYREIAPNEMSPAKKRVHDQIIAGKRGRFGGPFHILIRSPEICEYASKLGEHLRWGTSLPDRLSELAIITTARFWRAQYECYAPSGFIESTAWGTGRARAPLTDGDGQQHPGTKRGRDQSGGDRNVGVGTVCMGCARQRVAARGDACIRLVSGPRAAAADPASPSSRPLAASALAWPGG